MINFEIGSNSIISIQLKIILIIIKLYKGVSIRLSIKY